MNVPRGYYAKQNKSDRERQIPSDFIYMWNLKNKHTNKIETHRYREQTDSGERGGGWGPSIKGEGIKKYTLVVTEQSQRCKAQHRDYSQ